MTRAVFWRLPAMHLRKRIQPCIAFLDYTWQNQVQQLNSFCRNNLSNSLTNCAEQSKRSRGGDDDRDQAQLGIPDEGSCQQGHCSPNGEADHGRDGCLHNSSLIFNLRHLLLTTRHQVQDIAVMAQMEGDPPARDWKARPDQSRARP